jgi:hypothetical protein
VANSISKRRKGIMAITNIIRRAFIILLFGITFKSNAAYVGFEFSGIFYESMTALGIPSGSFAGGVIIYNTDDVQSVLGSSSYKDYIFNAPPVVFTFEIYKNINKEIRYALSAGQVSSGISDFDIQVFNGSGNDGLDTLNYNGYDAASLINLQNQPALTEFRLTLGGNGALSSTQLPDYVPDLSLFTYREPQIAAWAVDPTDGNTRHLFTVRNLSFTAIYPNTLNPIPVPAAVWLFGSGLIVFIGIARKKKV